MLDEPPHEKLVGGKAEAICGQEFQRADMWIIARTVPFETEPAVENIAKPRGDHENDQQGEVGIDMKEFGNRPIAYRDKDRQQPAGNAKPDNLADQGFLLFADKGRHTHSVVGTLLNAL